MDPVARLLTPDLAAPTSATPVAWRAYMVAVQQTLLQRDSSLTPQESYRQALAAVRPALAALLPTEPERVEQILSPRI